MYAVLFFLIAFSLQYRNGAYSAGFGSYPDEPAHYVTGLMVYKYLTTSLGASPMAFAERFYAHYPVVAFGHWPPLFYVIQALWGILAGGLSRTSALVLMAILTSLAGTTLCAVITARWGQLYGLIFGSLFVAAPSIQVCFSSVMAEMPLTLFTFASTVAFGRLLTEPTARRGMWFALCALSAICVKSDGWALMALPVVVPIILGSPSKLRAKHVWLPTVCVMAAGALMMILTMKMVAAGVVVGSSTIPDAAYRLRLLLYRQCTIVGLPLGILACLGLLRAVVIPLSRRHAVRPFSACNLALLASVVLLHAVAPISPERRYLCMSIPSFLVFAAEGLRWTANSLCRFGPALGRASAVVAGFAILIVHAAGSPSSRQHVNMGTIARQVVQRSELDRSVLVVATTTASEVEELSFAAELASLEEGTYRHAVIRAGKLLAQSSWLGANYRLRYHDDAEVLAVIDSIPVSGIILYTGPGAPTPHSALLRRVVVGNQGKWSRVHAEDAYLGRAEFFEATPLPRAPIRLPAIDMTSSLGRDISAPF